MWYILSCCILASDGGNYRNSFFFSTVCQLEHFFFPRRMMWLKFFYRMSINSLPRGIKIPKLIQTIIILKVYVMKSVIENKILKSRISKCKGVAKQSLKNSRC